MIFLYVGTSNILNGLEREERGIKRKSETKFKMAATQKNTLHDLPYRQLQYMDVWDQGQGHSNTVPSTNYLYYKYAHANTHSVFALLIITKSQC